MSPEGYPLFFCLEPPQSLSDKRRKVRFRPPFIVREDGKILGALGLDYIRHGGL